MRVAMIGQKGIPAIYGGIERHVDELSTRLADLDVDVLVYCRPWYIKNSGLKSKNLKYKGVNIIILPSFKTKHLDAITHTLLSTFHALYKKVDIIHYHGVGPSLLSWLPRILSPQTKVISTFHCIDRKHQKWGFFARLSLRMGEWFACHFAHETIAVSKILQHYCNESYDCEATYIPNGVTVNGKIDIADNLIKDFGLKRDGYIAMFSRLVRHKGAHYLIEAYKKLDTDLKLVIVGDSSFTDDYVKELKELAVNDKNIIFTGFQSGKILSQLFSNSLFVVHPSESEGLPIAVLEAMSYSKVVLCSDIPENLEAIKNYGYTFTNKDVFDLKDKMEILINNKQDLPSLGNKAKKFVKAKYDWKDIAEQTVNLYITLIEENEQVNLEIVKI